MGILHFNRQISRSYSVHQHDRLGRLAPHLTQHGTPYQKRHTDDHEQQHRTDRQFDYQPLAKLGIHIIHINPGANYPAPRLESCDILQLAHRHIRPWARIEGINETKARTARYFENVTHHEIAGTIFQVNVVLAVPFRAHRVHDHHAITGKHIQVLRFTIAATITHRPNRRSRPGTRLAVGQRTSTDLGVVIRSNLLGCLNNDAYLALSCLHQVTLDVAGADKNIQQQPQQGHHHQQGDAGSEFDVIQHVVTP